MPHFQPHTIPAESDEPAIDLESSGVIDMEQARVCGGNSDAATAPQQIEVVEPHAPSRCSTSDREILRATFREP